VNRTSVVALAGFAALSLMLPGHNVGALETTAGSYLTDVGLNLTAEAASDKVVDAATSADVVGFSNSYAGVSIVTSGLEISLSGAPPASVLAAISTSAVTSGVPVSIRKVSYSSSQLEQLTKSIFADEPKLRSEGIALSYFGPEYDSNRVVVHFKQYSSALAAQMTARYNSSMLAIGTDSTTYSASAGREADTLPWTGGDHIVETSTGY